MYKTQIKFLSKNADVQQKSKSNLFGTMLFRPNIVSVKLGVYHRSGILQIDFAWGKMALDGRQSSMKMEDNLRWKTIFNKRQPSMEDLPFMKGYLWFNTIV